MDDLSNFCCQNESCPNHGQRGPGNLTVCGYYGKDKDRRLLYCRTCKARFSERKGTCLFNSRIPDEKVESILNHIQEGCGVRKIARLTGVNKNTVVRYSKPEGEHSKDLHDEPVSFSP
jgi:LacI family transcriptional regulator